MAKDSPKTPKTSSRSAGNLSIIIWAAQCGKCYKWRKISTQEEYEEIRSKFNEEPFHCENKPNVSCDDPTEIEYVSLRTWVIDKPNEPKTPIGFKRELCLRGDKWMFIISLLRGRNLDLLKKCVLFFKRNSEFSDLSTENFSFTTATLWMILYPPLALNEGVDGAEFLLCRYCF